MSTLVDYAPIPEIVLTDRLLEARRSRRGQD